MGLTLFQFMAETGKTLEDLLDEVLKITGSFAYERQDLKLDREIKNKIIRKCREEEIRQFGKYKVIKTEDMDGWKYFFNKNEWFMVRPSGTEPVLRLYAEAETREKAIDLLKTCYTGLLAAVSD